jgi:hypothetical protein
MPSNSLETHVEESLSLELQQRLESALAMYGTYKELLDKERAHIEMILNEGGVKKSEAAGWLTYVTTGGTSSSFDKKKAIALGYLTEAQIAACTTRKPKKPFLTIKKLGEKDAGDDE